MPFFDIALGAPRNKNMRTAALDCKGKYLIMLLAIAIQGCGGGGGGGGPGTGALGNTLPPTSGPGDTQQYFPDATGDAWYYDSVQTPVGASEVRSLESVLVTGPTTVMGVSARVFEDTVYGSDSAAGDDYYFKNSGGVAYVGSNATGDTFSAAFAPYIVGLFPLAVGTVANITKNGVSLGADVDGDGIADTADLTLKAGVVGFETLAVDFASFANAVKTATTIDGNVILSSTHASVPFSSTVTQWNAPGVGMLKQTLTVTLQGRTAQQTRQARGYHVNGVRAGLSLPAPLLDSLDSADSNLYSPGPPALAAGGGNYLVVSNSSAGDVADLIDSTGASLNRFTIDGSGGTVAATFDGSNFFVAVNSNTLILHRITPAGAALDGPNGIDLRLAQSPGAALAAAHGQSNTLLVYARYDINATNKYLLYGVLVDADGRTAPAGEISIAVDDSTHLFPSVAFDGTNFLVVWQAGEGSGGTDSAHVSAARVAQDGTVLDSLAIPVSTFTGGQFNPSVAFDGSNYLVVWQDGRNAAAGYPPSDIYGARVSPDGRVLDSPDSGGIAIDTGGKQYRSNPQIAYAGSDYLVAWSDLGYAVNGATGIRLARMTPSATVATPAGGLLASGAPPTSSTSEFAFPIIATQSGAAAIVWLNNSEGGPDKSVMGVIDYSP
jgi:hypothetical protein